jgi:hypothetical protein
VPTLHTQVTLTELVHLLLADRAEGTSKGLLIKLGLNSNNNSFALLLCKERCPVEQSQSVFSVIRRLESAESVLPVNAVKFISGGNEEDFILDIFQN